MTTPFCYQDVLHSMQQQIKGHLPPETVKQSMTAYCESWNSNDIDARKKLFAEDAVFIDPKNIPAIKGINAIHQFWLEGEKMPGSLKTECHNTVACGDNGLLDFSIHLTNPDQSTVRLHVREVFSFNPQGKITQLEAYWDIDSISV